jgi:uncharacterized membrane protein YdjX (TVP38/TMEM64 family)
LQKKDIGNIQKLIKAKIRNRLFFIVLIIIISLLVIDYFLGGITHYFFSRNINELSDVIQGFGILGAAIFVLLITIKVMIAPMPGLILYVTGAALYGWFLGAILVLIGNMIGATLCFYLAKYLGRDYLEAKISRKKIEKFDMYTEKYGGYALFFLRINPLTSSDIISYVAGFSKIRFRNFFLGTLFGLIPLSFAQTYFGSIIINLSPWVYWLILGLSLLYVIVMVYLIFLAMKDKKKSSVK